jgi:hypothetical protein
MKNRGSHVSKQIPRRNRSAPASTNENDKHQALLRMRWMTETPTQELGTKNSALGQVLARLKIEAKKNHGLTRELKRKKSASADRPGRRAGTEPSQRNKSLSHFLSHEARTENSVLDQKSQETEQIYAGRERRWRQTRAKTGLDRSCNKTRNDELPTGLENDEQRNLRHGSEQKEMLRQKQN